MAAVSGKVGAGWRAAEPADAVLPALGKFAAGSAIAGRAASAGLPRGTVAVLSGARSLPVGMAAAVTAAGGHAAVVGLPDFGLLAAAEMGADLSRLAMIPDPGADPVEVAAVLMDGMDLVVLGLAGRSVPATRARAVVARARQRGCTLLVVGGHWQGASLRMDARVSGYEITGGTGGPGRPDQRGAGERRGAVTVATMTVHRHDTGAGDLVHGLAGRGRRGRRRGAGHRAVAVTCANRVVACSAAARDGGVRRGLRRREAQARCPQVHDRRRRPRARRTVLRGRDRGGGRGGAARRSAAARTAGAAGARRGPLLRFRRGRG